MRPLHLPTQTPEQRRQIQLADCSSYIRKGRQLLSHPGFTDPARRAEVQRRIKGWAARRIPLLKRNQQLA